MSASIVEPEPRSVSSSLMMELRTETAAEHHALENALDLLRPPFEQERFLHLLARFYGFHQSWEPAIRRFPAIAAVMEPRSRLASLRRDLAALGMDETRMAALPLCPQAASLARSQAHAQGSLYVIEGSSLGGQVIARAMSVAPWLPAGGLAYFNPYGDKTGAMWRGFKEWCESAAQPQDRRDVVEGARETFALLRQWLTA